MDKILLAAISSGNLEEVKRLVNRSNVLIIDNETGQTPLHIAAIKGDPIIIEAIVTCMEKDQIPKQINQVDKFGRTPLYFAASAEDVASVNYLLIFQALAAKAKCDRCETTALERAAELGHQATVESLMTAKGMRNAPREKAIGLAKRNGHVDVQSYLNQFKVSATKDVMERACREELQGFVRKNGFQHDFSDEILEKTAEKAAIHAMTINGAGCDEEVAAQFALMALYDLALLIDDSSSMSFAEGGKRIPALKEGVKVIADMYSKLAYADDGINPRGILATRFLNSNQLDVQNAVPADNLTAVAVSNLLEGHDFNGPTRIGTALERHILNPLVYRKLQERTLKRPLLIMIITDGRVEHEKYGLLEGNIQKCIDRLKGIGKLHWVVFQFTRIGDDKAAAAFLRTLQNHKYIGPYVSVSTAVYDVNDILEDNDPQRMQKMRQLLIGAIKKEESAYDDDDNEED